MTMTITDDIYDEAERLLRLPIGQVDSYLYGIRRILRSRMAEPELVPDRHARVRALIAQIDTALGDQDRG
ncbi:MAG: hypothetical protein JO157_09895 [Acetobacteraceae bacterium]|nr:hypothetical protein [Acetobacteraceae bacterium]